MESTGAVMTQLHQLAEATGESCGPVAVGSVTGASAEDTHLKAHRTAASLLKKGLLPDVSGAPKAA